MLYKYLQINKQVINMFSNCFTCKTSLEGCTPYFCCNKAEVFCYKHRKEQCQKCGKTKENIRDNQENNPVSICSVCRRDNLKDEMFKRSDNSIYCTACLNQQYQNRLTHDFIKQAQVSKILEYLNKFCCFCSKKISKRYIQLKDGRKIDSICCESNSIIQIKIKFMAASCSKCSIILGNSLQISSISRSEKYAAQGICKRCQQQKEKLLSQQKPVSEKNLVEKTYLKEEKQKRCSLCFEYFHGGCQIGQNTYICNVCKIRNNQAQKKIQQLKFSPQLYKPKQIIAEKKLEKKTKKFLMPNGKKQSQPSHYEKSSQRSEKKTFQLDKLGETKLDDSLDEQPNVILHTKSMQAYTKHSNELELDWETNLDIDSKAIQINESPKKYNYLNRLDETHRNILDNKAKYKQNFIKVKQLRPHSKQCNSCHTYLSEQNSYYYSNILNFVSSQNERKPITIPKETIRQADRVKLNLKQLCLICLIQLENNLIMAPKRSATALKEMKRKSPPKVITKQFKVQKSLADLRQQKNRKSPLQQKTSTRPNQIYFLQRRAAQAYQIKNKPKQKYGISLHEGA